MDEHDIDSWVDMIKTRGLSNSLRIILDVLEPLGIIGAQLLYVAQPIAGLFRLGNHVGNIAQLLEEPDGIDRIRARLDDNTETH